MGQAVHVLQEVSQAEAVLQPLRLQILERLEEPGSASSLAPMLGLPRQQINYHLRELERAGLVELVEERRKGNCVERLYRSSARSYVFAPSIGALRADPERVQDRLSSEYLVSIGAKLIDDLASLRAEADSVPTLAIETSIGFASDEDRGAFAKELASAITRLAKKYHDSSADAEPFRLVSAAHPEVARSKGDME